MYEFKHVEYLDQIRDKIDADIGKNRGIHTIPEAFIADRLGRAIDDGVIFNVTYVDIYGNKPSFVMACYPDIAELEAKSNSLLEALNDDKNNHSKMFDAWHGIKKWNIEIDKRLLTTGTEITVDNGSQFVAILCHEIGHIFNYFPMRLVTNYKLSKAKANMLTKMLMSNIGRVMIILSMPMFVCIDGLRIVVKTPINSVNEIRADARVPDQYKPYLIDYAENHIINHPMASNTIVTEEEYNNQQNKGIGFSTQCINLMKKRTTILKFQVDTFGKMTPSPYMKKLAENIRDRVASDDVIMEAIVLKEVDNSFAIAEKKVNTILETSVITDRDIALLQVDIDGMKTLDDKTYILNTIFDYLEICERNNQKEIKKIRDASKIPDRLINDPKIKTLNDMKRQVINTKITTNDVDQYSVYVKYPKGYEG